MLKKTMTTVDFGGTERTEDYYFNLTKAEIMEMQLCTDGGFAETVKKIVEAKNQLELTRLFKKIICASYGVLSPDGRKFVKNQQVLDDFMANGCAAMGLIDLIESAHANVVGVGIVIEKGFQQGGRMLREKGLRVESLAIVDGMDADTQSITFREN